jgi:predicted amidohydrolase
MGHVTIGLLQHACSAIPAENLKHALALTGRAAREEIVLAPVDLAKIDDTRTHWPFLRDRRIDAYADLTRRFIDPPARRLPRAKSR